MLFFVFFAGTGATVVHMYIETVWGLVVSWPPTLDFLLPPLVHLIIFPLLFPAAALVPLYCFTFVYSIEDV